MEILGFAYVIWAVYSGYKFMTGRNEWLDTKAPINMVIKFIVSALVGAVIGVFYFIYFILKVIMHFAHM